MNQTRATVDRSHFHEPEKGPEETPPCVPQLSATTMTVIDTFLQDAGKLSDHALIRGEMQRRNFRETFQIRRRQFHAMASSDFHAEHGAASYGNFKYPHEL